VLAVVAPTPSLADDDDDAALGVGAVVMVTMELASAVEVAVVFGCTLLSVLLPVLGAALLLLLVHTAVLVVVMS
jgi:hypothetical protein